MTAYWAIARWCGMAFVSLVAATGPTTSPVERQSAEYRDYSDVECISRALRQVGRPCDPLSIMPDHQGASALELSSEALQRIAKDHRAFATAVKDLSIQQLADATDPVILHVQANQYSSQADHYVLYIGTKVHQARILNPPHPEMLIPYPLLATRWHGEAIVVSAAETADRYPSYDRQRVTWYSIAAILCAVGAVGMPVLRRRWPAILSGGTSIPSTAGLGIALLAAGGALGTTWHLAGPSHFMARAFVPSPPNATAIMDFAARLDVAAEAPIPKIDDATAMKLHSEGILFVDARSEGEFAAGHIKGAMNAPAGNVGQIRLNMAGIPKDKRIVVYCAVSTCGKAEYTAAILRQDGFTNVSVYPGGWAEWKG